MAKQQSLTARAHEMFALVEKYLASGITQKRFCEQEAIRYSTFHWWLHQYRHTTHPPRPDAADGKGLSNPFIPLHIKPTIDPSDPSPPSCAIEYPNGLVVHLFGDVDIRVLSHLLCLQTD
jgi:hypothetical protein